MRASRQPCVAINACSMRMISGASALAAEDRSLPVRSSQATKSRRSRNFAGQAGGSDPDLICRLRKTEAVCSAIPAFTSTKANDGISGAGDRRSPIPDINDGVARRQTGTSAPIDLAIPPKSSG